MSVGKRKDGRWYTDIKIRVNEQTIRERDACGREVRNRSQALAMEHNRRAAMIAKANAPAVPSRVPRTFMAHAEDVMTLHAAVENKHSERASKRSILDRHLLPAFGALPVDGIGAREVAAYKVSKLGAGLSAKTVNNHLTVLRKCLVLARDWGHLATVPPVGFLRVKKPEIGFLSFDEARRLLRGADPGTWHAMILTGLRAGLRLGELLELRWEDVDLGRGVLHVRRAIWGVEVDTPKGGRSRDVPLGDELRNALGMLSSRDAGKLVFAGPSGRYWTKAETKWPLWRACKRAGLRRVGWHVLRHTFASHLVMRAVSLKAVQELLGHTTIEMTMRYAHLLPEVARDAVRMLDAPPPVGGVA